ncbi:MAG: TatD family hydrolase [Candidatus Caldatribacteriota bacterium]|nr:TatD family hydrolase [Candidatus Caldatribacteriota bacterium]
METHTHLDLIKRNAGEVVKEAVEKKVTKMITIGIDLTSSKVAIEFASRFSEVYAAAGYHPNQSKIIDEPGWKELEKLSHNKKVVAIGETGLDYYRRESTIRQQMEAFKKHLSLARKLDLPVIVHDREAHKDILKILEDEAKGLKIVVHCFSGDMNMAKRCMEEGYYIGIGGIVTFNNAKSLQLITKNIPLERILLETDSPFLAPHPYRGESNEPKYIPLIAEKIAELKGISIKEVAKITSANCKEVFGI